MSKYVLLIYLTVNAQIKKVYPAKLKTPKKRTQKLAKDYFTESIEPSGPEEHC